MGITLTRTEVVTTRVEHAIASGSTIKDIGQLEAVAWQDYCKIHGRDPNAANRYDDWCRVEARHDEIVLVFSVDVAVPDATS